jgi:hypothetical protein
MQKRGLYGRWLQKLLGIETKASQISDGGLKILQVCTEQLNNDVALRRAVTAHNKNDMYAWYQTSLLHVWMVTGRLYYPPVEHKELLAQALSDQFFHKVEDKLVVHGLTNPIAFNREFRRLASIFQGTCVAYDKAYVAQDDDAFSMALWRNLLNQDPKAWDPERTPELGDLVDYVKRQKVLLNMTDPLDLERGNVVFSPFADTAHRKQ